MHCQISACLLSSISQTSLREASFSCWAAMLAYLEEEDAEALIETTFFIVKHYWAALSPRVANTAKEMIRLLLDRHVEVVVKFIGRLPSLAEIPDLAEIESKLGVYRSALGLEEALGVFSQRINHDYSGVVHEALTELVSYLRSNHASLYASTVGQRPDMAISELLRALLDCAYKYTGSQPKITLLCTECVGLIGCLDSNQIETVRKQRSIVVLSNFGKVEEATDFALFLLEFVLVPAFLSATDTKLQGFLSFAMQELLERCHINAACAMDQTRMAGDQDVYRKWLALPENTRQVLTPFLTSRYMVAPMAPVSVDYPLFRPGKPYGNWLRSFVVDLLRKGQNPLAETMFEPLTRVIRVKDLTTAEFLLPYLVLHVLLGKQSAQIDHDNILNELLGILQYQPAENSTSLEQDEMKRYCHVGFSSSITCFLLSNFVSGCVSSSRLCSEVDTSQENLRTAQFRGKVECCVHSKVHRWYPC